MDFLNNRVLRHRQNVESDWIPVHILFCILCTAITNGNAVAAAAAAAANDDDDVQVFVRAWQRGKVEVV